MTRAIAALLTATVLAACAAGCGSGSTNTSGTLSASSGSGFDGAALPPTTPAPAFALTDQSGRRVSLSDYRGRVVVLAFVYSRCGASCLLVAQQVRGAIDELSHRPPAVIFLSADPGHDDAGAAAGFLARVSLAGRVEYLSGPAAPLRAALAAYHVTPPTRARAHFEPPAVVALIDPTGHERVLYGLEQLTPEALAHDVRALEGTPPTR